MKTLKELIVFLQIVLELVLSGMMIFYLLKHDWTPYQVTAVSYLVIRITTIKRRL
jgi:hypothetical protein